MPGLDGAFYVFESAPTGSDEWIGALTFHHDAPVELPRSQVRFVNNQVGYVFMGWMYGVTTDAGSTWSVWDAVEDLPEWQCCDYNLIKDVGIEADGTGWMRLNRGRGATLELRTNDFGRHWSAK